MRCPALRGALGSRDWNAAPCLVKNATGHSGCPITESQVLNTADAPQCQLSHSGDFILGGGVNRGAGKGGKEGAIRRALFVLSGVLGRILTCPETTEEPFFSPQLHIIFFSEVALLSTSLLPRFKQINKIKPRTTF